MSKERLEEIKEHFRWTLNNSLVPRLHDSEIEWLIEQAERVQELEEERDDWKYTAQSYYMTNRELREQNKRYREALEFYADENNYREQELKGIVPPRPITFKPILHDYGSIARQALEGEK